VAAGRALIGNELRHRTDARHAADRRWAFAQARTILGQILKLDRHAAKLTVSVKRYNSGMFLIEHLIRSGVLTLFAAKAGTIGFGRCLLFQPKLTRSLKPAAMPAAYEIGAGISVPPRHR